MGEGLLTWFPGSKEDSTKSAGFCHDLVDRPIFQRDNQRCTAWLGGRSGDHSRQKSLAPCRVGFVLFHLLIDVPSFARCWPVLSQRIKDGLSRKPSRANHESSTTLCAGSEPDLMIGKLFQTSVLQTPGLCRPQAMSCSLGETIPISIRRRELAAAFTEPSDLSLEECYTC